MTSPNSNKVKPLKGYWWQDSEDAESGIGVVAENYKEARKMGADWWGSNVGHDDFDWFILQRCKHNKDANVDGLPKGPVEDFKEGMRRGLCSWTEDKCDGCGGYGHLGMVHEGKCLCGSCEDKLE